MNEKIKVKVGEDGDYYISVAVTDNISIELNADDAANISECIAAKSPYTGKGWRFGYASEAEGKPERFGFMKSGAGLTIPYLESKTLKVFFNEFVKMVVNERITRDIQESVASDNNEEISEEEAMEKYPVTDVRNPMNLKYKGNK